MARVGRTAVHRVRALKRLPSRQFTKEDEAVFAKLFITVMPRKPGAAIKWLRATAESDRRDATLMLAWSRGWPIDLGGDDDDGECLFWRVTR
jgi:hypothetical protein